MTQPVDAETVCYPKAVPCSYGDVVVRNLMDDLNKVLEPAILKALVTHTGIDLKDPWDRVRDGDMVVLPGAIVGQCYDQEKQQKDPVREAVENALDDTDEKACLEWVYASSDFRKALEKASEHADESEWCGWIQRVGAILVGLESETLDNTPKHYDLQQSGQTEERHRELQHRSAGAYLRDCVYLDRTLRGFIPNQERMSTAELEILLKGIFQEIQKLRHGEDSPYTAIVTLASEVKDLRAASSTVQDLATLREEHAQLLRELNDLKTAVRPIIEVCEGEVLVSPRTCRDAVARLQSEGLSIRDGMEALLERVNGSREVSAAAIQQALDSLGPAPDF